MASSPSFLAIQKEVNDKYGNVLRLATGKAETRKLPTGVFNIDWCLRGGLPINRLTLVSGHKSSYKTTFTLKAIKSYQARCNFCFEMKEDCLCGGQISFGEEDDRETISNPLMVVYIDVEHALDIKHVEHLGVSTGNLYIFDPPHGEAACEYAEKFAKVPEVGMIVVDSLAALVPETELEKGYFDKGPQSLRARLISRMYRALITHLSRDGYPPRIAVALNHLLPSRDGYGDILPGGETQKYLSSVVLKLWVTRKQYITISKKGEEKLEDEGEKVIEQDATKVRKQAVAFLVEHSKVSPDLMKGEFEIFLGEDDKIKFGDTDDFRSVYFRALKAGILDGAKFTALKDIWQEDQGAYEKVKKTVIGLA